MPGRKITGQDIHNDIDRRIRKVHDELLRLQELKKMLYSVRKISNKQKLVAFYNTNYSNKLKILNNKNKRLTVKNVASVRAGKSKLPVFSSSQSNNLFLLNNAYDFSTHPPINKKKFSSLYTFGNGNVFVNPLK